MKVFALVASVLALGGSSPQLHGRIAFAAGPLEPGRSNIYVYEFATNETTRVTHDRGIHFDPALSPDGRRIAFRSRIGVEDYEVRVVNVDGTGMRNLTRNPAMDYAPAWSPDGRQIAFASERGFRFPHVWVMNADGSHAHVLTRAYSGEYPAWSPDGKRIVFATNQLVRQNGFDLVVVDVDGRNAHRVTHDRGRYEMGAAWSPDGNRIAYYAGNDGGTEVYVMRADGSAVRRLTHGGGEMPAWSQNGRYLVYAAPSGLAVVTPAGKEIARLHTGTSGANFPSWARSSD